MLKVIYAFTYQGKTYMPGEIVEPSLFLGKESILHNFLKTGFLVEVGEQKIKSVTKETPVKSEFVPKAVEIKTQEDLVKAVENKPVKQPDPTKLEINSTVEDNVTKIVTVEEKAKKEDNKIEIQPVTQQKGKAKRN